MIGCTWSQFNAGDKLEYAEQRKTLQEFVGRNANNVNVYIGNYKAQNAYLVVDPE